MPIKIWNPESLGTPLGQYSQVSLTDASTLVFVAGQVATNKQGQLVGGLNFLDQCAQAFRNVHAALVDANCEWHNVVQLTTYMVSSQDIPQLMQYREREFPKMFSNGAYPPNTLLMIDRLVREEFLVEIQAIAAR